MAMALPAVEAAPAELHEPRTEVDGFDMSEGWVAVETKSGYIAVKRTVDENILRIAGDSLKWHRGWFMARALWDTEANGFRGTVSVRPKDWHKRRPCLQRATHQAVSGIAGRIRLAMHALSLEQWDLIRSDGVRRPLPTLD